MHTPPFCPKILLLLVLLTVSISVVNADSNMPSKLPVSGIADSIPAITPFSHFPANSTSSADYSLFPAGFIQIPSLSACLLRDLVSEWAAMSEHTEAELFRYLEPVLNAGSPFRFFSGIRELLLSRSAETIQDSEYLDQIMEFIIRLSPSARARDIYGKMTSPRTEDAQDTDHWYYILLQGPVSVTLSDPISGESTAESMNSSFSGISEKAVSQSPFLIEYLGNTFVLTFPAEYSCSIHWRAHRNGTVRICCLETNPNRMNGYTVLSRFSQPVTADETDLILTRDLQSGVYGSSPESKMTSLQIIRILGLSTGFLSWRGALIFLGIPVGFLICLPVCLVTSAKIRLKKRPPLSVWILLCLYGIAALESEISYWLLPTPPFWRLLFKAVGALSLLFLFFLRRGSCFHLTRSCFLPLILGLAADIVISIHFISGVAGFLLFHLSLILLFHRNAKMNQQKWAGWAVLSAVTAAFIVLFFLQKHGAPVLAVAVYAPVLLLTAFSAAGQRIRLRLSTALFLLSDMLLGLFIVVGRHPVNHAMYMLLFVLALLILALDQPENADRLTAVENGRQHT